MVPDLLRLGVPQALATSHSAIDLRGSVRDHNYLQNTSLLRALALRAPALPWIGNLHHLLLDPFGWIESTARDRDGVFRVVLAGEPIYVVWKPEDVDEVMRSPAVNRGSDIPLEGVLGRSILTSDGDAWKRIRSVVRGPFHRDAVAATLKHMDRELDAMTGAWRDKSEVDIERELAESYFRFICGTLFGADRAERSPALTRAVASILDYISGLWLQPLPIPLSVPTPGNLRVRRALRTFDETVRDIIRERLAAGSDASDDLLGLLLASSRNPEDGAPPLSADELISEVGALLFAAYETTASSATWTLLELARQPRLQAELRESLRAVEPDALGPKTAPLLEAVIEESLRLHPPAYALVRQAQQDVSLAGGRIPRGSRIIVMPYLTHRDSAHWEQPERFDVKRFLTPVERHRAAYVPFGFGPHRCVGAPLAMAMLRRTVAHVVRHHSLTPKEGHALEPALRMTLRTKAGGLVQVHPADGSADASREASETAHRVLDGMLLTALRPETAHLVDPDARALIERMIRRTEGGEFRASLAHSRVFRSIAPRIEQLLLPGISLHYAIRKRFIEARVREALQNGAEQVVNLGAGLDPLCLRLHREFPHCQFLEVDHPTSQVVKKRILEGEKVSANLAFVAVDFAQESVKEGLGKSPAFHADKATVFVCEGVLPYLSLGDVRDLFHSLRALGGERAQVVFTFLADASPTDQEAFGVLLRPYLRWTGENIALQLSREMLTDLARSAGFSLGTIVTGPELVQTLGCPDYRGPVHDLEQFATLVAA